MASTTSFQLIEVADSDPAVTVSIPSAVLAGEGAEVLVKDTSGGASANNITVAPVAGLIDGSATGTIATDYGAMSLRSDGVNWLGIGGSGGLAGHMIEDEGSPLTQRSTINFVGTGIAATDAGGKTVVTVNAAAAPTVAPLFYSPADEAARIDAVDATFFINQAVEASIGVMFRATRALVCNGVKMFFKRAAADRTYSCKLWFASTLTAGVQQAVATVDATATGLYTATFASPVAIPAGTVFVVTAYNATEETAGGGGVVSPTLWHGLLGDYNGEIARVCLAGPGTVIISHRHIAGGGDVFPTLKASQYNGGNYFFPVSPVLDNVLLP